MKLKLLCVIGLLSPVLITGCVKREQSQPAVTKKISITEDQRTIFSDQKKNLAEIRRLGPEGAGYVELKGQDLLSEFTFRKPLSSNEKENILRRIRLYKKGNSYHLVRQEQAKTASDPDDFEFAVNSDLCICAGLVSMCDPSGVVDDFCSEGIGGAINTFIPISITWVRPPTVSQVISGDYVAFTNGFALVTVTLPEYEGLGLRNCIFDNSVEEWIIPVNESRKTIR
ncbi:hypothetical protein JMG10_08395 [Nostoc ellipsosporum NOK]|nr:hypothetical protein [Nostoc ellipsosporum NOK]